MVTEADFRSYIAAFNRSDFDALGSFYAPDIEFVGRAAQPQRETLTLHGLVVGPHAVVADLETQGETGRSQNFIWYDVADNRFTRIRSAHQRQLGADDVVTDMAARPDEPMSADRFAEYIQAFNRGDYAAFGDFYDENVVLDIAGKRVLRGRNAIFDFYRTVRSQTRRTIEVVNMFSAGNHIAAELQSEFLALENLPDFTAGAMQKGDRIFINTIALYELHAGRFLRIRSAELRKIRRT